MSYNIFTFDKATEQKAGALTMFIFSLCLLLLSLFILIFDVAVVSLTVYFLRDTSTPIYKGLEIDSMWSTMKLALAVFVASSPIIFSYPIAALKQLLVCYVELENGDLVKLRLQPRPSNYISSYILSKEISDHIPSLDRGYTFRTLTQIYGLNKAIRCIQNSQLISDYVEGRVESYQIEDYLLGNIQLVKRTKKKIIIMADIMVKGKLKRKKQIIYCMYNNMEQLTSICAGGRLD